MGDDYTKKYSKFSMMGFKDALMKHTKLTNLQATFLSKLLTYSFMLGFVPLTMKGTISKKWLKDMKDSTSNRAIKKYIEFLIPIVSIFSINFYEVAKLHEKKQKILRLQGVQQEAEKLGIKLTIGKDKNKRFKSYAILLKQIRKHVEK
jgi:hypothetical protein